METLQAAPTGGTQTENAATLVLIALFKLLNGFLLIAVGVGAIHLLTRDLSTTVMHWIEVIRVDPENRFVQPLLARVLQVSPSELRALGIGTFVYAALLMTEGIGLLLRKLWAEYFTIVSTGGLILLELYEIAHHNHALKILVLLINIGILVYLIVRVRRAAQGAKASDVIRASNPL